MAMFYNPETGQIEQDADYFDEVNYGGEPAGQTPQQLADEMRDDLADDAYRSIEWWAARGKTTADMFDANGQMKPGWTRTANGYEFSGSTDGAINTAGPPANDADRMDPTKTPTTTPGEGMVWKFDPANGWYQSRTDLGGTDDGSGGTYGGTYGGATGGGDYSGAGAFTGQYDFPGLELPRLEARPEFEYEDFDMGDKFAAPDPSQIENDPSYQWRFNEGQRSVKNSKAAQGVFGTGATMKALQAYGQNMAKTEYGDIYGRAADTFDRNLAGRFGEWNANRTNKLDAYKTNWGVTTDVYDRDVNATQLEFAPKMKWAELQFGRDWDLYKYQNDDTYRKWKAQGDWASAGSQMPPD